MKSAWSIIYGDEVGGALVDEDDDGDLLNDLVRKALGQIEVGRSEGLFAIGNNRMATESPLGSPTAISPVLRTFAELAARRSELVSARRRVRPQAVTGVSQISLL